MLRNKLTQALKDWQNNPKSKWTDEQKYFASEIFCKVGDDRFWKYCESCSTWFSEQAKKQGALIEAKIEKEKAEGKYYGPRNPKTYEGTVIENAVKNLKKETNKENQKVLLFFWQKPAGIVLITSSLVIMFSALSFLLGCRYKTKQKQIKKTRKNLFRKV